MLGILMKNELKTTWKIIAFINLFLIVITLLGSASFYSKMWTLDSPNIFAVICLIIYYLAIVVVCFGVNIYIAYRFYLNLYSDEGYLMHTLPVSAHQLLISKLVIASVQLLITIIVLLLCILTLAFSFNYPLGSADIGIIKNTFFNEFIPELFSDFIPIPSSFIILAILAMVFGSISSILMSYCAISLGQLFHKHKLMSSILCYLGIYIIMQIVSSIALLPVFAFNAITYSSYSEMFTGTSSVSLTSPLFYDIFCSALSFSSIFAIVFSVIFYILSYYMMNKKLNLD